MNIYVNKLNIFGDDKLNEYHVLIDGVFLDDKLFAKIKAINPLFIHSIKKRKTKQYIKILNNKYKNVKKIIEDIKKLIIKEIKK
jgi:hypothetical protein